MGWVRSIFGQPKIKDGIAGQGVVMSIPSPTQPGRSYNIEVTLSVQLPGQTPYLVEHNCWVDADKYPWPGTTLPITVDPGDPQRLRIEWDQVPTTETKVRAQHEQMVAAQAGGGTPGQPQVLDLRGNPALREQILGALGAAQGAAAGTPPAPQGDPTVAALEKLVQLRDAGVLSPSEFEAQKARILGKPSQ